MDRLAASLSSMGNPIGVAGDSFCDRLNSGYTVGVLVLFSIIVTTKGYVGEPIQCYCPDHFTSSQVDFANSICWVTNTYYLPFDKEVPKEKEPKDIISYYQWVGLILICQAFMFYFPKVLWSVMNQRSGIAVSTIMNAAVECQVKADFDSRDRTIRYMVKHMGRFLKEVARKRMIATKLREKFVYVYGNYLTILYLFIKLLYIANVIGQIFMLNVFLHTDYSIYGIHVVSSIVRGVPWSQSDRFPRQTMCDFKIRVLGNVQRYSVQCALPVNLFNEKIYIFVWFWFVIVAAATSCSFLIWLFHGILIRHHRGYITRRLIAMEKLKVASDSTVNNFIVKYLRRDGIILLRLVTKCTSDVIAAELLGGLWEDYKENEKSFQRFDSREMSAINTIIAEDEK